MLDELGGLRCLRVLAQNGLLAFVDIDGGHLAGVINPKDLRQPVFPRLAAGQLGLHVPA